MKVREWARRLMPYRMTPDTEPILRGIYEAGVTYDGHGRAHEITSAVSPEQGERLYRLVLSGRPCVTLEIGLACGLSALYICRGLRDVGGRKHIAIDPYQSERFSSAGISTLQRAGYGKLVELHEERSDRCLPRLVDEGVQVGFALIDGWHTFDYALVDFYYVHRLLRIGGIVVFHDCQMPAVRRVTRLVLTHRDYERIAWKRPWRRRLHGAAVDVGAIAGHLLAGRNPLHWRSPGAQMVALRKRSDDEPGWDFYSPF